MTDYRDLHAAQRAVQDPTTSAEELAQLALHQPALQRSVALHPNSDEGLLGWLELIGDPAVTAAVRSRRAGAAAPPPPPPAEPSAPPEASPAPLDEPAAGAAADVRKRAKPPRKGFFRRRRALVGTGIGLLVLGLAGSGFAGGWIASSRWSAERISPELAPSVVMIPDVPEGVRMPDLRGLGKDEALQVIADAGWDVSKVTLTGEPFAGAPGVVVAQTPAFGATDVPAIALTLSEPALVPEVAGRKASELITQLRNLGANVQLEYGYDPAVAAGGVLSVTPVPGQALTPDATVTIAESGTAVFLSQLKCPSGCFSQYGELTLDGARYDNGLSDDLRFSSSDTETEVEHHEYQLGRHADLFIATVGVPDDVSETGGTIRVRLVGDGKELATVTTGYSQPVELKASVTGVLRIDVQTSFTKRPAGDYGSQTVALGDARVVGSDSEMALLLGE